MATLTRKTIIGIANALGFAWLLVVSCTAIAATAETSSSHTSSSTLEQPFDHTKTGFILRDVHTTLRCEQCHIDGIFKNTPKNCAGCHAIGTRVAATPKPVNHVQTTLSCDTCHQSQTSFQIKNFNHIGITGNCVACHNAQSLGVVSKPPNHFPTLKPCENCHTNTVTFAGWKMDHTGITSGCASCHRGQYVGVVSMPVNHIPTSGQDCSSCHASTQTFLGASYSHAGVSPGSCDTCHNGSYPGVRSKPATHVPTPAGTFCDTCHTQSNTANYTTFLGSLLHQAYSTPAGSCLTCHTGAYVAENAIGKPANHIPTSASCDTCHTNGSYTTFSGGSFHTVAANNAALGAGPCTTCHNGSYLAYTSSNGMSPQAKIATHIPTTSDCFVCHTSSNTANYTTFLGAGFHGIASNNAGIAGTCGKGGCHDTVGGSNASGAEGRPITAVHNGIGINCDYCHTVALTLNYTTFLGATYTHNTPPGVCSTCHNGSTATGKPATHIPTAAGCDACHALPPPSGSAVSFAGATFHTVAANNASAAGACGTCHNGGYTSYTSGNGLTPLAKSTPHIPTTASCDTCHTSSNTAGFTSFLGATYNHTGVAAGTCTNCHNGSYPGVSYQSYCYSASGCPTVGPFVHSATGAQPCDACHTAGASANYTTWANAGHLHSSSDLGKCQTCHNGTTAQGMSAGHIPTGSISCDACHALPAPLGSAASFYPGNMNHTATTAMRCDSCHNGSYTTQGVQAGGAQAKVSNHIPTTITGSLDCNTCHNITPASSVASMSWLTERMNHNNAQGGGSPVYCVTCHLSGTTYLGNMRKTSHNGASTARDCSSSSCHKPLGHVGVTYSSWGD